MIAVIGGWIVPSFTCNRLVGNQLRRLPVPTQRFDKLALLSFLAAILGWTSASEAPPAAALLLVAGVDHLSRLTR